ncbi:hypothetical protein ASH00_08985 [Arthrobacter sp. Soil782]|uniref:hypothetical protein n=1 Tax=Arthrobacter sp. Soil782 TaxID=1736410 RepID=UPI0007009CC0|nr:hypothetical protein [Arthrobacter sp. Soil782]KRF05591.1 hypothetical protein ASH00_08985 [Arthrobacter sp. Soil782]
MPRQDDREAERTLYLAVQQMRRELEKGDPEFALRILVEVIRQLSAADDLSEATQPPSMGSAKWDALITAAVRYACRISGQETPVWTQPKRLPAEWFPYDFRPLSEAWKDLSRRETPPEFAEVRISIRERSLHGAG